jgi:hypothetical protein
MNSKFQKDKVGLTLLTVAILLSAYMLSCKDTSSGPNKEHNFVLTIQQEAVAAYVGTITEVSFAFTRLNNSNESIVLTPDADTSVFRTRLYVTNDNAFVVAAVSLNAHATQGVHVLKFTASLGNDSQIISLPVSVKSIPRYSHLTSNSADTISLKANTYQDINIIPLDSASNTIPKSFFDSLRIGIGQIWFGSNASAIMISDQSNSTNYVFRIAAISSLPDTTNHDPIKVNFTLASRSKDVYVHIQE